MARMVYTPKQILEGVWFLAVLAHVVSVALTPVMRWVANRRKMVDRPDDLLKPHGRPIAYLGGVAVCAGFMTALLVGAAYVGGLWALAVPVCLATVIITLTGLLDDLYGLKPAGKVLGQVLAAGMLYVGLCSVGIHISAGRMFIGYLGVPVPVLLAVPFSAVLTVVVVIAACNATNLLDGLDGLCGGVTGIIALGFVALTVYLACYPQPGTAQLNEFRVVLALAMAGAVFGFLPYNAPPASIFLGDAGSMLLGFMVAALIMLCAREGSARWFLACCVIFGLPIIDTALAVVRRCLAGVSIFTGDRSHLYDQLVDRGMSVGKVVRLFYALAVLAAALGVAQSIFLRGRYALLVDLAVLAAVGFIFVRKGMLRPAPRLPAPPADADA